MPSSAANRTGLLDPSAALVNPATQIDFRLGQNAERPNLCGFAETGNLEKSTRWASAEPERRWPWPEGADQGRAVLP